MKYNGINVDVTDEQLIYLESYITNLDVNHNYSSGGLCVMPEDRLKNVELWWDTLEEGSTDLFSGCAGYGLDYYGASNVVTHNSYKALSVEEFKAALEHFIKHGELTTTSNAFHWSE